MSLRQGEIYWIDDCPPLHGTEVKPHAVIILNPTKQIEDVSQPLLCMVVSSSVSNPGSLHIPMPNKRANHPCSTCFDRPCWAVSNWILRVNERPKLASRCGHIGGATLRHVVAKYVEAIQNGTLPIDHPAVGKGVS